MIEARYYPIIYLRGYASNEREIEDTVSTPHMGFNLGSTRIRQPYTGNVQTHVFESPLPRLIKDYNYVDAYQNGQILPQSPISSRSVWIFPYYDVADEEIGEGERQQIETYVLNLRKFLLHVRQAVLEADESSGDFRAYLVVHSMG